jgi:adenylosuccinate lyase
MGDTFGYDTYLSPFTWRYGTAEMRHLFAEVSVRESWRAIWVKLAQAQASFGLLRPEEVADLRTWAGREHIDLQRAHQIEREIGHDLMAEIRAYAEQATKGGGKLHLGATSADIEDNADIIRFRRALRLVLNRLVNCLAATAGQVTKYKGLACLGWTHLQPAEPTTLGYRLATYAQDLLMDLWLIEALLHKHIKGKGMKGAVGTSASYQRLLAGKAGPRALEAQVMKGLRIEAFPLASQTYPRKVDYLILAGLGSIAQSCHKFGFDLRILQSPPFGELAEPIKEAQVGSSAMPFKRNPVLAERMCSLARFVAALPYIGFMNAANSLLERTLDDSANRRIILPEAFLAIDECLTIHERLMKGVRVYPAMLARNLQRYGAFAGTEALLVKLVEQGRSRQEMHERLRVKSFEAWEEVMKGKPNPLPELLKRDPDIAATVRPEEVDMLLDPAQHVGDAEERCETFVHEVLAPVLSVYAAEPGTKHR